MFKLKTNPLAFYSNIEQISFVALDICSNFSDGSMPAVRTQRLQIYTITIHQLVNIIGTPIIISGRFLLDTKSNQYIDFRYLLY